MSTIEITIHCPELAMLAQAIEALKPTTIPASTPAPVPESAQVNPNTQPSIPATKTDTLPAISPAIPAGSAAIPQYGFTAPNCQVAPAPVAPVAPAQTAPVAPVSTAAPSYTMNQLAKAGAELAQAGKMDPLQELLRQFGVQAITYLPKEQYGAFALALRGLGAQL